ncbi:MAG: DUF5691 domain-containing protein [Chloroflexota bacterium]
MSLNDELLSTAALGTAQRPVNLPTNMSSLPTMLAQPDPADRVKQLMTAVATWALQEKAGYIPGHDHRRPAIPCPVEDSPLLSERAMQYFMLMLKGQYQDVMPEWLREAAVLGKRLPEEYLPTLLTLGRNRKELRDLITPLIGARGHWLAEQIKDQGWKWFEITDTDRIWSKGTLEARITLFETLRKSNSRRARQLLTNQSKKEGGIQPEFLALMRIGLTEEDVPVLETALHSTVKDVRTLAADLLARLPQSPLVQRMIERAEKIIKPHRTLLGGQLKLILAAPEYTQELEHDGIQKDLLLRSPFLKQSLWWVTQILSFVPPSYWLTKWNVSQHDLIWAAAHSECPEVFWQAWSVAINRIADWQFGAELLPVLYDASQIALPTNQYVAENHSKWIDSIVQILTPEQCEALAVPWLRQKGFLGGNPAMPLLKNLRHPWSRDLTQVFLESLQSALQAGKDTTNGTIHALLKGFAYYMLPDLRYQLSPRPDHSKNALVMLTDVQRMLDFRAEMLAALHEDR